MRNRRQAGLTCIGTDRDADGPTGTRTEGRDMTTSTVSPPGAATADAATLSNRDRAVLRAVAAGRCVLAGLADVALRVDGLCFADQFAGPRLAAAGLIAASTTGLSLTAAGRAAIGIG